jgi:hypothetical protein
MLLQADPLERPKGLKLQNEPHPGSLHPEDLERVKGLVELAR